MVNNRGWLRIVEASIAVLVVLGFLIYLRGTNVAPTTETVSDRIYKTLEEISRNATLRKDITRVELSEEERIFLDSGDVWSFVKQRFPEKELVVRIAVCNVNRICSLEPFVEGTVYSGERVIAPGVREEIFDPKKIKIFVWESTE